MVPLLEAFGVGKLLLQNLLCAQHPVLVGSEQGIDLIPFLEGETGRMSSNDLILLMKQWQNQL